jgi:hypothetical protein
MVFDFRQDKMPASAPAGITLRKYALLLHALRLRCIHTSPLQCHVFSQPAPALLTSTKGASASWDGYSIAALVHVGPVKHTYSDK